MISAEIEANSAKVQELANEKGAKIVQNVAAGVVEIVVWPLLFAMDAKGAADQDMAALQAFSPTWPSSGVRSVAPGK
jgi:hypothetical protein